LVVVDIKKREIMRLRGSVMQGLAFLGTNGVYRQSTPQLHRRRSSTSKKYISKLFVTSDNRKRALWARILLNIELTEVQNNG